MTSDKQDTSVTHVVVPRETKGSRLPSKGEQPGDCKLVQGCSYWMDPKVMAEPAKRTPKSAKRSRK